MTLEHNTSDMSPAQVDASLLAGISNGDETAMARFYSRHASRVYSVALRVLRDPSSAEDVLQDIFMQIWRDPSTFNVSRGSLQGWLSVVARNRAVDVIRKRKPSEVIDDLPLPSGQNLAVEVEYSLTLGRVRELMSKLPHEQRHALELAFFKGLTHSEIAQETGDPLGTVKTRIRVALQTIAKLYKHDRRPTIS